MDPSRKFTRLSLQGGLGEDVDLATTQVGQGGSLNLSATFRPEPHVTLEVIASTSRLSARDRSPDAGRKLFSANA